MSFSVSDYDDSTPQETPSYVLTWQDQKHIEYLESMIAEMIQRNNPELQEWITKLNNRIQEVRTKGI